jgi:hypothetical protein
MNSVVAMQFLSFGKKFKCETCGEKFKTEVELQEHGKKEHKK